MIDIHSHILPGIDDGSRSIAESLTIIERALAIGIHTISVSPHVYPMTFTDQTLPAYHHAFDLLREAVDKAGLPIHLRQGYEVYFTDDVHRFIEHHHVTLHTENAMRYALLEMPEMHLPQSLMTVLFELKMAGITPILAHPERNILIEKRRALLDHMLEMGVFFQLDAGSVLGAFGPQAKRVALSLLRDRNAHIVASDVHNLSSRPVEHLHHAYLRIGELLGDSAYLSLLFEANPLAAITGNPIQTSGANVSLSEPQPSWWRKTLRRWVA